jgi:hypothetical protein
MEYGMSDYAYPYDSDATLDSNVVRDEVHTISDYPNKHRCIIPTFAPFYRKDFTLVHVESDRELLEGLDYYLGHYFESASEKNRRPIFGSVMLNDHSLEGKVKFKQYRTLGSRYLVSQRHIQEHLSQVDLKDPRNLDWVSVMKYEKIIPDVSAPTNREQAIEEDPITGALDRLRAKLQQLNEWEKETFDQLIERLTSLNTRILDEDVPYHENRYAPHQPTHTQLGALHKDAKAMDALKVYGYTLAQLVNVVNELGITADDTEELFKLVGDTLEGRLTFNGENAVIRNKMGVSTIRLNDGMMNIISNGEITLKSDDREQEGEDGFGTAVAAAENMLTVHSTGQATDDESCVFNGFYLIHVGNMEDFVPPPEYEDTILHVKTSDTIHLSGRGIESSPLTGYVFYPIATLTSEGIFRLSHSIFSDSVKLASSEYAVGELKRLADKYVDDTVKVSGKRLNKDITLTKSDFGLGNVDNTAPNEKVASDAFKDAASEYAESDHKHDLDEFKNMPIADTKTYGIGKTSETYGGVKDKAASMLLLDGMVDDLKDGESRLEEMMPPQVLNATQYGGFGYLPVPVYGAYKDSWDGYGATAVSIESDGRLVALRNGQGMGGTKGVYYWYAELVEGVMKDTTSTIVPYKPKFLPQGVYATRIIRGGRGVFLMMASNGKQYVVIQNGTMNADSHLGAEVLSNGNVPANNSSNIEMDEFYVYRTYLVLANGGLTYRMSRALRKDIEDGKPVAFNEVLLSGVDFHGNRKENVDMFVFTNTGHSSDPNDKPLILRKDDRFTGSNNVAHAHRNTLAYLKDGKLRVTQSGRSYFSSPTGSAYGNIGATITVDLDTFEITCDTESMYPNILKDSGFTSKFNTGGMWPYAAPNHTSTAHILTDHLAVTVGAYHIRRLCTFTHNAGSTMWHDMNLANRAGSLRLLSRKYFNGNFGSIVGKGARSVTFISDDKMVCRQRTGGDFVAAVDINGSYDGIDGWGPTTYRESFDSYRKIIRIPRCWDVGENVGFVLNQSERTCYSKYDNGNYIEPVDWDSGVINQLLSDLRVRTSELHNEDPDNDRVNMTVFGDWRGAHDAFVVYIWYIVQNNGVKSGRMSVYSVDLAFEGGSVSSIAVGREVSYSKIGSPTGIDTKDDSIANPIRVKLDDGNWFYALNLAPSYYYVGNSGQKTPMFILDENKNNTIKSSFNQAHTYRNYGWGYHPNLGLLWYKDSYSTYGISATTYEPNKDMAGKGTKLLLLSEVKSGWVIYFSNDERFYTNGTTYILPKQSIDLTDYPGINGYKNKTFYIYVEVVDGKGQYTLYESKLSDRKDRMYVGYCTTGDDRITDIQVERATRMGNIYELEQHIKNKMAHGGINNVSKDAFGLGKVRNMGMFHDLSIPTFKEVFDNWTRISHIFNSSNQPAKSDELSSWKYDAGNDAIICPINSGSFVGFVSPTEVGEYHFDTLVGSPHNDNDGLIIILAYKVVDGQEHTLCAVRSRSTEGHIKNASRFDIWYNYHQPSRKLIKKSALGTGNLGGWSGNWSRITADRVGDDFTVSATGFVKSTDLSKHGPSDIVSTLKFNVMEHPELQKFRSGGSFGYGSMSQPNSTYRNIFRPDEQIDNYYASADMLRLFSEKNRLLTAFTQGFVRPGANVPVPAGFKASECTVYFSYDRGYYTDSGHKLIYGALSDNGIKASMESVYNGGEVKTSGGSSYLKYILVARKNVEV